MTETDKIVAFPDRGEIELQAAEWIMRLEEGDLSPEDKAAFHAWRNAHELHREVFGRLSRLWGQFDILGELADHAAADENVEALAGDAKVRSMMNARRAFLVASAASIAVVATGALYRLSDHLKNLPSGVYQTAVGQQQTISLPDGSVMQLNTNTLVEVTYTDTTRLIRLARGEAHFEVAPDKTKPFSVQAGEGVVTAVGTAFTVHVRPEDVEVTVAEGRVTLSVSDKHRDSLGQPSDDTLPTPLLAEVSAGQNVVFHDKVERIEYIEPAEMERKLSWRQGVLAFSGEPLSSVLSDISRYTDITIEIVDDDLRDLTVTGYFKIGNVNAMLEALEVMADVYMERINPKLVRLSKQPPA